MTPDLLLPDERQIEVHAGQVVGGAGSCGLAFAFSWGESIYEGYQLGIDPIRSRSCWGNGDMDGTRTTLLDWTHSPAIQQGTATDHVEVIREGEVLRLTINGAHVATYYEPRFLGSSRDRGVRAHSQAAAPIDVRFDDSRVSCPP